MVLSRRLSVSTVAQYDLGSGDNCFDVNISNEKKVKPSDLFVCLFVSE